nr:MAG TPA: tail protein [Caudoviricetes sp.]
MIGLKQIKLNTMTNENTFNYKSPSKRDEYILKGTTGLASPSVTVNLQKTLLSGSFHTGSRANEREVTLEFILNPDRSKGHTVEYLRDEIYQHILAGQNPEESTTLTLVGSVDVASVECYISNVESDLYTKEPVMQLTLQCASPYFESVNVKEVTAETTEAGKLMKFEVFNPGAPVGFILHTVTAKPVTYFGIASDTTGQKLQADGLDLISPTPSKSGFVFDSTEKGRDLRHNYTTTESYYRHVFDKVTMTRYGWVHLAPGKNAIRAGSKVGGENASLRFRPRYWGV